MWDRGEIKKLGKASFKQAYGTAVAVCLILTIIGGIFSFTGERIGKTQYPLEVQEVLAEYTYGFFDFTSDAVIYTLPLGSQSAIDIDGIDQIPSLVRSGASGSAIIVMLFVFLVGLILRLVLFVPLSIGSNRFFMELRENKSTPLDTILYIYKQGKLGNAALIMFLMFLYTSLWTLLLIVPGIIKSYEYRMIPYILCENPGIEPKRAFKLSKEMMAENKMDTFILDLSFIGWGLLSFFTLGLLNIFFLNPYFFATHAELYAALREDVLNRNIADTKDFPGFSKTASADFF